MPFLSKTLWTCAQTCPTGSLGWARGHSTADSRLGDVGVALESLYLQGAQDGRDLWWGERDRVRGGEDSTSAGRG